MIIERFSDVDEVNQAAAQHLIRIARKAIAARGQFAVALSGGSTPRVLFHKLSTHPLRDAVEWSSVHFFWGDERAVPPDHADSNYGMAQQELLSKLPIDAQQVHRMEAERSDIDAAACEYEAELDRVLAHQSDGDSHTASPPRLDLILLGLGPDGHTASLFPGTKALQPTDHLAVANFVPKLDAWRMTLTPHLINTARHVFFVVAGGDKADAVRAVMQDPRADLPSQLIRPSSGELRWLLDGAAASQLDSPPKA